MKKLLVFTLSIMLLLSSVPFLLAGCSAPMNAGESPAKAEYRKITPKEAKAMMDAGGIVILDVRTQEEFDGGHIKGAVLLPDTDVAQKAGTVIPDKSAKILVYCHTGRRSGLAAHALVDMGYTGVYDFGGIADWPYDIVK